VWQPVASDTACLTYNWDFGVLYGTSTDKVPHLEFPKAGGTFPIKFKVSLPGVLPADTAILSADTTIMIDVPEIGAVDTLISHYMGKGDTFTINDSIYTKAGLFTDTLTNIYGCDSILRITIRVLETDTVRRDTAICDNKYVLFHDTLYNETGTYKYAIKSAVLDYDSIIDVLRIDTREVLKISLGDHPSSACANEPSFAIPYSTTWGVATGYKVEFDEKAHLAGFQDYEFLQSPLRDANVSILLPDSVHPDYYSAKLIFYNSDCGNVEFSIDFVVMYPVNIIRQKWNDVLAVTNYAYNGGYNFSSFQWFRNGFPMLGENGSYIYLKDGETFVASDYYQAALTRVGEKTAVLSCPLYPVLHNDVTLFPTYIPQGQLWTVWGLNEHVTVQVWDALSVLRNQGVFPDGNVSIRMPNRQGVYLVRLINSDGTQMNISVLVY
jgi:hypothetical protein